MSVVRSTTTQWCSAYSCTHLLFWPPRVDSSKGCLLPAHQIKFCYPASDGFVGRSSPSITASWDHSITWRCALNKTCLLRCFATYASASVSEISNPCAHTAHINACALGRPCSPYNYFVIFEYPFMCSASQDIATCGCV